MTARDNVNCNKEMGEYSSAMGRRKTGELKRVILGR